MKKVFNKTFAIVAIAFAMVLAIFGGIFFTGHNEVASADGSVATVKFETDATVFTQGSTINVTGTLSSAKDNTYCYSSITFYVGIINSAKDGYDTTKTGYLTFTNPTWSSNVKLTGKNAVYTDNTILIDSASAAKEGSIMLSLSLTGTRSKAVDCSDEITFSFSFTIDSSVPDDTKFSLGIAPLEHSMIGVSEITSGTPTYATSNTADVEITPLEFTVRKPKSDKNLSALEVGQDGNMQTITDVDFANDSNINVTLTDPTAQVVIKPTVPSDSGATIYVKKPSDSGNGTKVTSGSSESFDIPADGVLSIIVQAEDETTKTYTLTIKVVGATLTKLTVKSDTKTSGVTEGVKEKFDSKTTSYTVLIPSDATKATINATVSTGHSEKTTLALATLGTGSVASSSVASGTDFDMTGIKTGDKLTITASADDGSGHTSTTEYTLTFKVVSIDTEITLDITGKTSSKRFTSNSDKATENNVDYYYIITGETNAASTAVITFPTNATEKKLNGTEYTSSVNLTAGTHTITVKAEAGNTKTYTFILKAYTAIKLKSGITADFIYEDTSTPGKRFRKSYSAENKVHGVDDLSFDRLVIGNILPKTSINDFLNNFDSTTANAIKLYKADGTLVYDQGAAAGGLSSSDLSNTTVSIGTSWKLEYIVDSAVEETIYLSVLGDSNGDGYVNATDIAVFGKVVKKLTYEKNKYDSNVEYRLASYVVNQFGTDVAASDITEIANIVRGEYPTSHYF